MLVVASHLHRTPPEAFSGVYFIFLNATIIWPATIGVQKKWQTTD
jgi:hypothetical protein